MGFSFLFHKGLFAAALHSPRKPLCHQLAGGRTVLVTRFAPRRCPGSAGGSRQPLFSSTRSAVPLLWQLHKNLAFGANSPKETRETWAGSWDPAPPGQPRCPPGMLPSRVPAPGQRPCGTLISSKELKSLSPHPCGKEGTQARTRCHLPVGLAPAEGGDAEPRDPQRVPIKDFVSTNSPCPSPAPDAGNAGVCWLFFFF